MKVWEHEQPTMFKKEPIEYGDITASRHLGNARSIEANGRVDKARQHRQILETLDTYGPRTTAEIAQILGVAQHKISGRFKALREAGRIELTGQKRDGGNEYRLREGN